MPGSNEVFFPEFRYSEVTPATAATGELVLDDEGCLRLEASGAGDYRKWVLLWQPQYEPSVKGRSVRVLDENGRVVAVLGKIVTMGGGDLVEGNLREQPGLMDKRAVRELFERCPGNYWMVMEDTVKVAARE